MSHFLDFKNNNNDPIRLTEAEMENPIPVFLSFFADNSMSEVREHLYAMLESCLTTDAGPFKIAEGRSKLFILHRSLERLVEASLVYARSKAAAVDEYDHFD